MALPDDCKKALGYPPKVNWTRIREKAHVKSDVKKGSEGGKGGSSAFWVLGSENTTTATRTETLSISENTSKNIEPFYSVFSGTSQRIQAENTSENTQGSHGVLSESVLSESCPESSKVAPQPYRPGISPFTGKPFPSAFAAYKPREDEQ